MRAKSLLSAAVLAILTSGVFAADAPEKPATFNPRMTPVVSLVKRVKAAVVNIHSERSVRAQGGEEFFALSPSQNRVNGMGTGIILDPRGYIITNYHVVEDVSTIRVRLLDGTVTGARVVARDNESDLALIKIDVDQPLPVMPFGTATDLMVGETVVAIGNAYGYDHTVSVGVISAINRDVTLNKEISYKGLVQTDAAINPGNSGGPLLNIRGELIGVNVAIRAGAQGIGFAIPVDSMLRVAADLLRTSRQDGLTLGMMTRDRVEPQEITSPHRSLLIEQVEATSIAGQAGLKKGDVLVKAAGQEVTCRLELERALTERTGRELPVEVNRDGKVITAKLVLDAAVQVQNHAPAAGDLAWRKFGLKLSRVGADVVNASNKQLNGGLLIDEVAADSTASKAGLQRGDVLVGLHQWEMLSMDNIAFVLTHPDLASFSPLRFYIVRNGQVHRGWLGIAE